MKFQAFFFPKNQKYLYLCFFTGQKVEEVKIVFLDSNIRQES